MAINFSTPTTTDNYLTGFVPNIQSNQVALAQWLDSTNTTITGSIPTYAKRYNRSGGYLEEYSGTTWSAITLNITGNANTATTAGSATGGSFYTATASGEGQVGIKLQGYSDVYMYSSNTTWGMYSAAGGSAFQYTRSNNTFNFNGNANTATTAGIVNNGVYTVGDQSIAGTKNFTGRVLLANGSATAPSLAFSSDGAQDTGLYWGGDGFTYFTNNQVKSGEIQPGGNLVMVGNVTAYSDSRIKTNLLKIDSALDKVCQLAGYTFDRTDISTDRQTGLLAQDVLKVLPEAVQGSEDTVYAVAYGNMMGLIVEAIKELRQEIREYANNKNS